jgi:hypothetical protein
MPKNNNYSHRASSSEQASNYKKKGHEEEEEFASLIDGRVMPGQQKVDVIGPKGTRYSCKGGGVHWQILLYSPSNFINNEWGELGVLFEECLNCFPIDYSKYLQDKINAKEIIYSYLREKSGKEVHNHEDAMGLDSETKKNLKNSLRNNHSFLKDLMGLDNTYLNAKFKMQVVTRKIKEKFEEEDQIRSFLEKGMFANQDVDKLVVKENANFLVFDKSDVLDIFDENLKAENSVGGHGIDDINLDGQKTIIKYKTNIIELEIRNDSIKHYRQVRFNMKREKALTLFKKKSIEVQSPNPRVKCYKLF